MSIDLERMAAAGFELDEILMGYLDPLARIIGHGMDETIDQAEALEISYSMVKALGRELWIYQKRNGKQRQKIKAVA
jgi:hypothetical protein